MKAVLDIGVLGVTVLMMLTVGMELEGRHFREVVRHKWEVTLALAGQAILLPLVGLVVIGLLTLPPHLSAGILLLTACPIGDIANFYTLLARANVALSVTLNTLSCLLSIVAMAVAFKLYAHVQGHQFLFAIPTPALVGKLTLMVVLPVLAGMGVRHACPGFVQRHAGALRTLCVAGIGFLLLYVLVNQRERLAEDWQQTAVAGVLVMVLAMLAGLGLSRILRMPGSDQMTAGLVFATRNVALASAIAITLLNRVEYAVFAAVYFLTEVPLLLGIVATYRCWGSNSAQPVLRLGSRRGNT